MRTLKLIFEEAGYEVRSYSGRGMMGKECLAIDTNCAGIGDVFADVLSIVEPSEVEMVAHAFRGMRQDSMGKGEIAYFPRIPADEGEDESDFETASKWVSPS